MWINVLSRNLSFVKTICEKTVLSNLCGVKFSRVNRLVFCSSISSSISRETSVSTSRSFATSLYSCNKGDKMNNAALPKDKMLIDEELEDVAVPNEKWSKEAVELYNKLNEMPGDWKKSYSYKSKAADGSLSFSRAVTDEPEKFLEYAFFNNPSLQCSKGVVQFGLYTRGPIGHVHGGAIATILDIAMGNLIYNCGFGSVTGNLNIDYVRPLPLDTTTSVKAKIDKIEGRKIFASAAIKTVDGSEVYSKATSIFIMVKSWKSSM